MALARLVVKMREGGKRGHQGPPRPGCAGNNGRFEKARTGRGVPVFLMLLEAMGNASAATGFWTTKSFGKSYALVHTIADRVAVEVDRLIPGQSANCAEFVFELSHEPVHVKMDARFDKYLVETFATAVSLRVLRAVSSLAGVERSAGRR